MGNWLEVNGPAIYNSKVWRIYGEGPTKVKEGQFTDSQKKEFTSEDIRYTVNGDSIYATVLMPDENENYVLPALGYHDASQLPLFNVIIKNVFQLGTDEKVNWEQTTSGLKIKGYPTETELPVVFQVELA